MHVIHRRVEAWSMAITWTGFPFKKLLNLVIAGLDPAIHRSLLNAIFKDGCAGQVCSRAGRRPDAVARA